MVIASVSLDASNADANDVAALLHDGQLSNAEAWLNTRWGDFSALDLAREAKLESAIDAVTWEPLTDDTPGTLQLTIFYPLLTLKQAEERLSTVDGIENYELENADYDVREIVERHSATMD